MADFIAHCTIVFVALSPLLRRCYIERFWVHGRGTVIRLEVGIDYNSEAAGAWLGLRSSNATRPGNDLPPQFPIGSALTQTGIFGGR